MMGYFKKGFGWRGVVIFTAIAFLFSLGGAISPAKAEEGTEPGEKYYLSFLPEKLYLHPEELITPHGLITAPVSTQWHELYPEYCNSYHLSSWEDNKDGVLSPSDQIDLTNKETGETASYHVDEMTTTIFVSKKPKQEKIKQIPVPWQFWTTPEPGIVRDIIRLSETFTMPVTITREFVTLPEPIGLDSLTWERTEELVAGMGRYWEKLAPTTIEPGGKVRVDIPITEKDKAVMLRYTVEQEDEGVITRFTNEAILKSPQIVGQLSNFEAHNNTDQPVDNLELDFIGDIEPSDVVGWYPGWGAPPEIKKIPGGIEVKWIDTENPILPYEWRHFGLRLKPDVPPTGVQAFWTKLAKAQNTLALEYEGDAEPWQEVIYEPVSTQWHEVHPTFSNRYHLADWEDNEDGVLSPSDQIALKNKETGEKAWYHVDEVTTNIIVSRKPTAKPDIWISDCPEDNGTLPTPVPTWPHRDYNGDGIGDPWWVSDDIWVDNDGDGIPDTPVACQNNTLYARVHNIGNAPALNVTVYFYYRDPSPGLIFPDGGLTYGAISIGSNTISSIPTAGSVTTSITWHPAVGGHWCVGVGAETATDPISYTPQGTWNLADDNNVGCRNFGVMETPAGKPGAFELDAVNPFDREAIIEFGLNTEELPEGWEAELSNYWLELGPKKIQKITLIVIPPTDAEPGDEGIVHVTEYAGELGIVGGYSLKVLVGVPFTVVRDLPAIVGIGETFDVPVNFSAPEDNFNSIGLTDFAPDGWNVAVDKTWCTPNADAVKATDNKAEIAWYGPYNAGTEFTAVYKVTVPDRIAKGIYSFSNGTLEYYIGTDGPYIASITGDVEVVEAIPGARISGSTGEVNCSVLPEVTIKLLKDGEEVASTKSDEEGNYEIIASETGDYEVVAGKSGFRDETRTISITELGKEYTLDFRGEHGPCA